MITFNVLTSLVAMMCKVFIFPLVLLVPLAIDPTRVDCKDASTVVLISLAMLK